MQRSTLTGAVLTAGTDGELKVRGENIGTSTLTDSNGNAVEYTKVDADTITLTRQQAQATRSARSAMKRAWRRQEKIFRN